ncbi:hypothetical protein [Actinoplanes sp. NPDC051851]|uniref:hypothetical protein n=1 Tax=Actinoplanes sp. NPDC051851 TaxID=3154753 RepID=UPI0034212ACB
MVMFYQAVGAVRSAHGQDDAAEPLAGVHPLVGGGCGVERERWNERISVLPKSTVVLPSGSSNR